MLRLLTTTLILLSLPAILMGQYYCGENSCGGGMNCHNDKLSIYNLSGHPHQLTRNFGNPPWGTQWPYTQTPSLPYVGGSQIQWSNVEFVIGNYYWMTRFIDRTGRIITGRPGDSTQYNIQSASWVPNQPGEIVDYDCGRCHTTGYDSAGYNPSFPNVVGSWMFQGVECEACHGPSSGHVAYWPTPTPGGLECEECHRQDPLNRMRWRDGFMMHGQEAEEIQHSPWHNFTCTECHDQHRSTVYNQGGVPPSWNCNSCDGHNGISDKIHLSDEIMGEIECIDCHLPKIGKVAETVNQYKGDLRGHIIRIRNDTCRAINNTYQIGDTTFWCYDTLSGRAYMTLDYVCLGCHIEQGIPMTMEDASAHAQGIHFDPPAAVSLTPFLPPIVIRPGGGYFGVTLNITNNTTSYIPLDGRIEVSLPDNNVIPLIERENILLTPGAAISRQITQYVPASAPPGSYRYRVLIWDHISMEQYDRALLFFEKLAGESSEPAHESGWLTEGWDDESASENTFTTADYELKAPHPNPFNPQTSFIVNVPRAASVELAVYDITGRLVRTLHRGDLEPGRHHFSFNGNDLPSGIYFCRFAAEGVEFTEKMVLMK